MASPEKILVVDDDPVVRHLLLTVLGEAGYVVDTAADGKEGLEKYKVFLPDLVILDIAMPKMDGYTFLLELKSVADMMSLSILVLTSHEQMREIFKLEGVNDYLIKPFQASDLLSKIRKRLACRHKKILIVDDQSEVVALVDARLSMSGYEVLVASDGLEALEKAKKERPDLIVLDVMLPRLDGLNVCRMLKFDSKYKDIRIVLLTARFQEEDRLLGQQVGADAYLTKPFDGDTLLHIIKRLLWD